MEPVSLAAVLVGLALLAGLGSVELGVSVALLELTLSRVGAEVSSMMGADAR